MTTPVRVAFLQFDARENDRAGNLEKVTTALEQSAERGVELLVLPELWASGYDLRSARAEGGWEREIETLRVFSEEHGIAVIGSFLESAPDPADPPYNCAIALQRGEVRGRYRKVHLFRPLGEPDHLAPGNELPAVFPLAGVRTAMAVCYDLRFPELFRPAALAGVELFVVCAQWPTARIDQWRALLIARAIENQCYVLGVNRRGIFDDLTFGGCSMLVGPTGDVVVDAGEKIGGCVGELDPEVVRDLRRDFPVLGDRRTDLYGDGSS